MKAKQILVKDYETLQQYHRALEKEQVFLKKKRDKLNKDLQKIYDRFQRNGVQVQSKGGATYVPLRAVQELPSLLRNLAKVQRQIRLNRFTLKGLSTGVWDEIFI